MRFSSSTRQFKIAEVQEVKIHKKDYIQGTVGIHVQESSSKYVQEEEKYQYKLKCKGY
jgi:hypothetical protein